MEYLHLSACCAIPLCTIHHRMTLIGVDVAAVTGYKPIDVQTSIFAKLLATASANRCLD